MGKLDNPSAIVWILNVPKQEWKELYQSRGPRPIGNSNLHGHEQAAKLSNQSLPSGLSHWITTKVLSSGLAKLARGESTLSCITPLLQGIEGGHQTSGFSCSRGHNYPWTSQLHAVIDFLSG